MRFVLCWRLHPASPPKLAQGQSPAEAAAATAGKGRILLVLPFDNRTGQPSLEWIREASPELLSSRLASAGFAPMSRADRMYALDHLGLPQGFQPSRASSLKLAQTLDADSIVVGSYMTDGTAIVAEAQMVDVPHLRMRPAGHRARRDARSDCGLRLAGLEAHPRSSTPTSVAEETFVAAGANLRLDAFEQYIRGISESDQAGAPAPPAPVGPAQPGVCTGLDGTGPRGLQRPAV